MGSTRLPGKVLRPIAGQPLLWHIVHRLREIALIEDVAIATTTNPLDDAIVEFGRQQGVTVVRGPEDDVLARFALAAEATGCRHHRAGVVRCAVHRCRVSSIIWSPR